MRITIYGSGYVGLVAAACFAKVGNEVLCMDVDEKKIEDLNNGIIPIYEPGLSAILSQARKEGTLQFTTDVQKAVLHGLCQFIAVGTPPDRDGNADLKYVMSVVQNIAFFRQDYTIIINKSTVPIGTGDRVEKWLKQGFSEQGRECSFDVVSNPEFLKEGTAIKDFCFPDRIILGVENSRVVEILKPLYSPFYQDEKKLLVMDRRSAELSKYAANAMLATKISFMNEIANLAEKVKADVEMVRKGIGSDPRIGMAFTYPGCGYGGSCFGKDLQALIHTAQEYKSRALIVQAVEKVNAKQKLRLFEKIMNHYEGNVQNKIFAVWGLAFKPETDDMREAPSVEVIKALLAEGAKIQAFDPEAMTEAKKVLNNQEIVYGNTPEAVLHEAHALVIFTEWAVFRRPDFNAMRNYLFEPVIFDGRNMYDPAVMASLGFSYYGIGRGMQVVQKDKVFS